MSLKEIPFASLSQLRELYRLNWPEYVVAFNFIDSFIERYEDYCKIIKVLSIDGGVDDDATFIGIMHDKELFIATLEPSLEKLKKSLKLIDFSMQRTFMCTKGSYRKLVFDFIAEERIEKVLWDNRCVLVHLLKNDALELDTSLPDGFKLQSLSEDFTDEIQTHWTFSSFWFNKFIEFNLKLNPSIGLFDKNNELVSWCLSHHFRMLLALQTHSNHFRKGFAEIVTKALSKMIAQKFDCDITAVIMIDNPKSLKLFTKIGFKEMDDYSFIGVSEKVK